MSERLKEIFRFREDASTKEYAIAGGAGVVILVALYFIFFSGSSTPTVPAGYATRDIPFWCTKANKEFTIPYNELEEAGPQDFDAVVLPNHIRRYPSSLNNGKKTGVRMISCLSCKKWFCPDWWKRDWSEADTEIEKPLVCPHCGTDRDKYLDKMMRR
ncbi:MAG: hypothetical protein HN370_05295 [Phycisphaerales bacterium]|nr:hypothetical protein [Phycisphaerales bacterium]